MAQGGGLASDPESVHVGYVVDTQALWRFVRVVGFFPVSVISPVLHTHLFHLPITDAFWSLQCAAS